MHDNKPIRSKPSEKIRGASSTLDYTYNEHAGAFKTLDHIVGRLIPLGNAAAGAINATKHGALIALFAVGGVAFVNYDKTGAVAVPTGGANGVALRPNDYTVIALGIDELWFVADGAVPVWAYLVDDDTIWKK